MESKIAKHICLNNHPVAVLRADSVPQKAICFKEGKWGCVVALIKVASQGKIAAAAKDTTVCMGGRAGLGFQGYEHGWIEYFLSTGNDKIPHSEFYKKTPELAKIFTDTIPKIEAPACLVFKPLDLVEDDEKPECIIFLVNADQLSFSIPYSRFLEMEQEADGCFFTTDTWETIKKRI